MTKKNTPQLRLALTHDAADALFVELLRYWDEVFKPKKGVWVHPEDGPLYAEYRKAIKLLLDFMK